MAVGLAAATLGDNIGYTIGRFGGSALVPRVSSFVMLAEQRLRRAAGFFNRHGGKIVAVARFIEGRRQVNGIIAGITGMRWRGFLAFAALGAAAWMATWASVGDLAGDHITALCNAFDRYSLCLSALLLRSSPCW